MFIFQIKCEGSEGVMMTRPEERVDVHVGGGCCLASCGWGVVLVFCACGAGVVSQKKDTETKHTRTRSLSATTTETTPMKFILIGVCHRQSTRHPLVH